MSISTWVSSRYLKLNMPQTERLIFSPKNCTIVSISRPDNSILRVAQDKISEASLSSLGIQALIKSCWLCSQNTFRTQPLDSASTFNILFWDIVNSCLDPSNSLLTGFPASFLFSSQLSTQQTEWAFKNMSYHVMPLLQILQWHPVSLKVKPKVLWWHKRTSCDVLLSPLWLLLLLLSTYSSAPGTWVSLLLLHVPSIPFHLLGAFALAFLSIGTLFPHKYLLG